MPRRKNVGKSDKSRSGARRSTRRKATDGEDIPEVYTEMLVEAYREDPDSFTPDSRPAKRRKTEHVVSDLKQHPSLTISLEDTSAHLPIPAERQQQVVFQNDFDDSDESDAEFEDVEIHAEQASAGASESYRIGAEPLQIDLAPSSTTKQKTIARRKPVTKAERIRRLDFHKWHILSILIHVAIRNRWCDNQNVQNILKPLIPRKTIARLHLDESESQAKRKISFDLAIEQICEIWTAHWKAEGRGMKRAFWREHLDMEKELDDASDPVDLDDFQEAATNCVGSRDTGAQLFCALLRSAAVETRLVCSLQVLPFSSIAKGETPQKPSTAYIQAGHQNFGTSHSRAPKRKEEALESPYPIFWVEVLNPAITQWIPLDPVVRRSINKPRTSFEPPASDNLNSMCYVIAFEDDGTAKDVTKRYAAAYNAKTRKNRVESTHHGEQWWNRVTSFFEKDLPEPRDDIEEAALNRQVVVEGMPKNVQDFKDHPVYVLERHLRASEVIQPRREAGKFTVGTGKNQRVESVYRRQDVHLCKSANAWYRKGRDVRAGEAPLKTVISRNGNVDSGPNEEGENNPGQAEGTALYAEYQTEIYVPPPIVDGLVPRNGFGNLDIYVQSMIPAGGVHFRHPLAVQAAKALHIDFAEAVTGFSFKGRQGTAILDGIVISAHHTAALVACTKKLEIELEEQVQVQRQAILLATWKKMLAVLRIRQRVQDEYGERAGDMSATVEDDEDDNDPTYRDDLDGGFMPDVGGREKNTIDQEDPNLTALRERQPIALPSIFTRTPVAVVRSLHAIENPSISLTSDMTTQVSQLDVTERPRSGLSAYYDEVEKDSEMGGGFVVETEDDLVQRNEAIRLDERQQSGNQIASRSEKRNHEGLFTDVDEQSGGFLLDNVDDFPTMEASSEQERESSRMNRPAIGRSTQGANDDRKEMNRSAESAELHASDAKEQNLDAEQNDETQSHTSGLSHDPEEDDLEPEWLADAFED